MIELRLSAEMQSSDSEFEKSQQYLGNRRGGRGKERMREGWQRDLGRRESFWEGRRIPFIFM